MIDVGDLRELIVRPVLAGLGMLSPAAENLVIGTALTESMRDGTTRLRQIGGGPALGIYQMEPATAIDLTQRYLQLRRDIQERFEKALWLFTPDDIDWDAVDADLLGFRLVSDLGFATAMCRLRYWIVSEPLPAADDVAALGGYWKVHYNTRAGAGTVDEFIAAYRAAEG